MRSAILVFFCAIVLVSEISGVPIKDKKSHEVARQSIPSTTYNDPLQSVQEGDYQDGSYTPNDPFNTPFNTPCSNTYGCDTTGYPMAGQPQENLFNKKVQLVAVKDLTIKNGKVKQPTQIIQG